jgi:hypothetical protein
MSDKFTWKRGDVRVIESPSPQSPATARPAVRDKLVQLFRVAKALVTREAA